MLYPENLFNRVTYTYGEAGDKYNRVGRISLVEDASGGEAYYYDDMGEAVKTVRTVMVSQADIRTYVYGATYDSWNRVRTMTYPDGEVVTYGYNAAGQIESLKSNKSGKESVIVENVGYDELGHTVYTKMGNGTETTYSYDKKRERLQGMNLLTNGSAIMHNKYNYDAVDNILGITDDKANITQYDAYLPYGELLVDEHNSNEEMPYKFNGKEMDKETELYYYDARYMNPVASIWYGVDPLAEKYPNIGGYVYCIGNTLKLVDQDGRFCKKWLAKISRSWYNLWHKQKAGKIIKNEDATQNKFKYTYNTGNFNNGEFAIESHYKFDTKLAKDAQDVGDATALVGYGATLSGVGAEVGVPLATVGNAISTTGSITELSLNVINGEYDDVIENASFQIAGKVTSVFLNKILPGGGKKIGEKGFNLGTEILKQDTSLKISGIERMTDLVKEKNKDKKKEKR